MRMNPPWKAVFFDLSGVLYEGTSPIPGAAEAVAATRASGRAIRFVTNTATRSRRDLLSSLSRLGIEVEEDDLFTAPLAAKRFIERKGWRPYCLVHDAIAPEFESMDQDSPNCVLLGDARDRLNYESLNHAFQLCHDGAALIGIGMNRYFKGDTQLQLDAGPFIKAVAWAADVEPLIMGKPGREFFDEIVASTSFTADECVMIGDDVEGDVIGAMDAGLGGILVKTGKFRESDLDSLPSEALVIDSVADLIGALENKKQVLSD